jgi:hypothetical protein
MTSLTNSGNFDFTHDLDIKFAILTNKMIHLIISDMEPIVKYCRQNGTHNQRNNREKAALIFIILDKTLCLET